MVFSAWSQDSSSVEKKSILIIKGNSYLEDLVTKIIIDSLQPRGYRVVTAIADTQTVNMAGNFSRVTVFNTIKTRPDKTTRIVDNLVPLIAKASEPDSKILLFSVYGELWKGSRSKVDAVTAATKTLKPTVVAAKIITLLMKPDSVVTQ